MTTAHRHRGGGFPLGKTITIVLALHAVAGGGLLFLAKTQTGQELARTYHIKLFQPEKPPPKPPPPKETPPPPKVQEAVKAPEPQLASVPAPTAPSAPEIGSSGGMAGSGVNWNGGIFSGGFEGPDGAFHAAVTASFRRHYHEPKESFGSAQLQLVVTGQGKIKSFRLVRSSGDSGNDRAILAAAAEVQSEGVTAPPKGEGRVVTVRFVPY